MNLKDLEERLNTNEALRDSFIKNPAKVLKGEGVKLAPAEGKELAAAVARVKWPKATRGKARKPSIRITIRVGPRIGV